jgi:hypothetical protein
MAKNPIETAVKQSKAKIALASGRFWNYLAFRTISDKSIETRQRTSLPLFPLPGYIFLFIIYLVYRPIL